MRRKPIIIFPIICFVCLSLHAQSLTRKALFLGNSYTYVNNLPLLIANAANTTGDTLIFDSNTPGGYTLEQHSLDSASLNKIISGGWDYVILQEQSQLPSFQYYDSNGPFSLCSLTRKYNPCARKMFYMTWGRKNGDAGNCVVWPPVCTYQGMDSLLRLRYIETAQANNAEVSPVGAVWRYLRTNNPSIELYDTDGSHPSAAGSYAAACTFYATIFRKDPNFITYDFSLSPSDASAIRNAAKVIAFDSLSYWDFADHFPDADFTFTIGSGMNEVVAYNTSFNADTYSWDFGDGNFSTDTNPTHNYLTDGNYTITLTANNCDIDHYNQSVFSRQVTFCPHQPVISPNSLVLCPGNTDTLFTQTFDAYQWLDNGDSIPGAVNSFLAVQQGSTYSVFTTLNNCTELSAPVDVVPFNPGLVIYHMDTAGTLFAPDTACAGDTIYLFLSPNKPDTDVKYVEWFENGMLIQGQTSDTMAVTASGIYTVTIRRPVCPNVITFQSDPFPVTFVNCNIGVEDVYDSDVLIVYPNPNSGTVHVSLKTGSGEQNFSITNTLGEIVKEGTIDQNNSSIDLSGLTNGIWMLRMKNISRKIVLINN